MYTSHYDTEASAFSLNFIVADNVQSDWPDCSVKESRLRIVALPIFTAGFILGTALFIILHGFVT